MVLYFDRMQDVHLTKDVGLVPHFMVNDKNIELEYVTADKCITNEFRGHNITKIKRFPNAKINLCFYYYLLKNRNNIDYLTMFHCRPLNLLTGIIYKLLNKNGKFYIKMDKGSGKNISMKIF